MVNQFYRAVATLVLALSLPQAQGAYSARAVAIRDVHISESPSPQSASDHFSYDDSYNGKASVNDASAFVDPNLKIMRLSASSTVTSFSCYPFLSSCVSGDSFASGSIHEVVTAYSPSAGTNRITFTIAPIRYDGRFTISGISGFTAAGVQVDGLIGIASVDMPGTPVNAQENYNTNLGGFLGDLASTNDYARQSRSLSLSVINGTKIDLEWMWGIKPFLSGPNQGFSNAHGSIAADFSNTATWGGIDFAYDLTANRELTDFTFISASGIDWATPGSLVSAVPEPSAWGMLFVGLGLLVCVSRRGG